MEVLERVTKPVVVVSLLWVAALLATRPVEWSALPWVSLAALAGSFFLARRFPTAVASGWVAGTYIAPGLLALTLGNFRHWDLTPWFLGLMGAMLATSDPTRWHFPPRWRAPLVSSMLAVALSWPIIWLRELDFLPSVVGAADVVNNGAGVPTDIGLLWVYGVVLLHGVGLLWLDWLYATFPADRQAVFLRRVMAPLAMSWALGIAVGVYQSVGDIGFLNPGFWATMRRASGLGMDANPFGMAAALWGGLGVALLLRWRGQGDAPLTPRLVAGIAAVLAASWYGVWVSGSRSALLAGVVMMVFVLVRLARPALAMRRGRLVAGGALAALLLGAVALPAGSSVVGPWQRVLAEAPSAPGISVRAFAVELWERNNYGAAAVHMIADSPLVGVGAGAFHLLVPDVGHEHQLGRIEPDNAQNWWRHQVAELGLLGGLGWLVWSALLAWLVVSGPPVAGAATSAGVLRGVFVALGVASMLGMPTQNPALALTFWTGVFWLATLVGVGATLSPAAAAAPGGRAVWAGVWLLVAVYLAGFAYESWTYLRPPMRANRADWDYSYGLHGPDPHADGGTFRWTQERALIVVPLTDRWIEVTAWAHHPDLAERPVRLQVWIDGAPLIDAVRTTGDPITEAVRIPENRVRVTIETAVDRTWRPVDYGQGDDRTIGAGLRWRFIDP